MVSKKLVNFNQFYSVIALCVKTPVYGTLIGFLNVKDREFGQEIVERTGEKLQDSLNDVKFNETKMLVRLLAELVKNNVLLPSSLMELLQQFVDVAKEDSGSVHRSDYYMYLTLSALPWVLDLISENEVLMHFLGCKRVV